MSFDVPADAYHQFMGRFSEPLAERFAGWLELAPGQRVLDVGCGPGALTAVLARRTGAEGRSGVSAIDPSESFVVAVRGRLPGIDARKGSAEAVPFPDAAFDCAAAQLVVQLMADPAAGIAEMARVTRPGGIVAATVWDFAGETAPVSAFWRAAREVDASPPRGTEQAGGSRECLTGLLRAAKGLAEVESTVLSVSLEFGSFEEWWHPFTLGVGPPGAYLASLDSGSGARLKEACARQFPQGPFTLTVRAWAARGRRK